MEYPALVDVRKSLRIKWYRCPINTKVLHKLVSRDDKQGFIQAGGHLGLWLLTGTITYVAWAANAWLLLIPAVLVHGLISSFFKGTAPHELGHGTVFRTPAYNRFFLYLFSLISWWDPHDYASSHTHHHRYTLHPDGDRENLLPISPFAEPGFLLQLLTINVFGKKGRTFGKGGLLSTVQSTYRAALGRTESNDIPSNEWLNALHADQPDEYRKSIRWSRFLLVFHGTVFLLSLISGQWIFIFIVTLSSFTTNWMSYRVGMTQHCGLKENDIDFRKCTRSVVLNPVLEFLYWHMNWHTEHHMFAGVPCYNLKKLHQELRDDMPSPRTVTEAWQEMRETWDRQQVDSGYFFDTPLPANTSMKTRDTKSDPENHESIGDLAPPGLREPLW
ncbi:MAG: fatty acid desaturase [Granulosicoccus sp.]